MKKVNYVSEIKDLELKKELLDNEHQSALDYDIKLYEQTGIVRSLLMYVHTTSFAEILYNTFGITEWDKKRISLEEEEIKELFNILNKILNNAELSHGEMAFFSLVKSPYPDFVRNYYAKYISDLPDYYRSIFMDKAFPYKLYIMLDGNTRLVDGFLKKKQTTHGNHFMAVSDLSLPLDEFFKYSINKNEIISLEKILYILRYADEEVLKESPYAGGDLNYKINAYNMPLRDIMKLSLGTTNGGHRRTLEQIAKELGIPVASITKHQMMDYFNQLLRRQEEEILHIHKTDRAAIDNGSGDEFKIVDNITLTSSKIGMFDNNLQLAYKYYYNMLGEREKEALDEFAQQRKQPKISATRISMLIVAYLYMTQDMQKLVKLVNCGKAFGTGILYSKDFCQEMINDYNSYMASLEASSYQP